MLRKIVRNDGLLAGILSLVLGGLLAVAHAATPEEAAKLVKTTTDAMLKVLQERRAEITAKPDLIYELADRIAVPHFDFERITQHAMGKAWRQANATQKSSLIKEFRALLVHTYAKTLLHYSGQEISLLPLRPSSTPNMVQINTEVNMSGVAIPINYRLYLSNDKWRGYDVVINGVSLVANYRQSFAQEIRKGGIDGLIQTLKRRNQDNSP